VSVVVCSLLQGDLGGLRRRAVAVVVVVLLGRSHSRLFRHDSGHVAELRGRFAQASHTSQITHLVHYRNVLISGAQDGTVLVWVRGLAWHVCWVSGPVPSRNYGGFGGCNALTCGMVYCAVCSGW